MFSVNLLKKTIKKWNFNNTLDCKNQMFDTIMLKFLKDIGYSLYCLYRKGDCLLVTNDRLQVIASIVLFNIKSVFTVVRMWGLDVGPLP